ncbi:ATP-binding protein [Streptomyces sp. H28]|uniref:ATP-binding protein n=1 Tax=Streptomyces sp. H28 TaxID=2775865 RepID=UPI00178420CF|nr:ATP-binding protein [Streptomyces sp. H28]MBD9734558.1 ATP-binding protein [Streptomyces sp. H28]
MHDQQPGARRRIDFAGLQIPAANYALPSPSATLHLGADTPDRLDAFYAGRLTVADLTAAETDFLREHFRTQLDAVREQNIDAFERRVPRRYAAARPDAAARNWADAVTVAPHTAPSLLVLGPTGTGKTHFAYGALRAVAETGLRVSWRAFTEPDLFAHLRPTAGRDDEQALQDIAAADLLFIDDLGAAKLSDWTEEITYRVINYRYEQCLPGIYTSNIPPKELAAAIGTRIASRLTEMCDRIALKGDDLRKGARP